MDATAAREEKEAKIKRQKEALEELDEKQAERKLANQEAEAGWQDDLKEINKKADKKREEVAIRQQIEFAKMSGDRIKAIKLENKLYIDAQKQKMDEIYYIEEGASVAKKTR